MKKHVLLAALLAPMATQAAETIEIQLPEFYGKLNLTVQSSDDSSGKFTEVNSNASRLGLKGKGELKHGIQAIYQVEYQTTPDSSASDLSQRNTFAGLKGAPGQLIIGTFDTPLKVLQKKVDQFNDLEGDIKSAITVSDNRKGNSVMYTSPRLYGLQLAADHVAAEQEGRNDGTSVSLTYDRGPIYFGVARDTDVEGNDIDVTRVVAQTKLAGVQFGALWEQQEMDDLDAEGWMASLAYKLDMGLTLKAQYGESDIVNEGMSTYSVGADYSLGKGAKAIAFYTDESADDEAKDASYAGMGIEFKF
ncbi:porin [Bacterioplanes sanyensis]|uniref:Porin n=1 Tax=Bacterioplanes sanyensis TaxID=1249553 RepID=A0A222FGY4_9GAMM|nr:porin [Bacterioplanes sanyensis]ASP38010.1 porin [Bacterioplanes sanyensis]